MGLFSRKSSAERQAEGREMADKLVNNKGFFAKLTNAIAGPELADALRGMQGMQHAKALQAAGATTEIAVVAAVNDTGMSVNDNPRIMLVLDLGQQQMTIDTIVSRLEIPRVGDRVGLVHDPQSGQLLYAGLAQYPQQQFPQQHHHPQQQPPMA